MQLASCFVRLFGDINNEVPRGDVTPAEVAVLQSIHGPGSVVKIQPTGMDKRPHGQELERLKSFYNPKVVTDAFPGVSPKLPVHFKDIGIDVYAPGDDEGEIVAKPKKSKKASNDAADLAEDFGDQE